MSLSQPWPPAPPPPSHLLKPDALCKGRVSAWLLGAPGSSQISPAALPTRSSQLDSATPRERLRSPPCLGLWSQETLLDDCLLIPQAPAWPPPLRPHLGAPWGKPEGHRLVCQQASPAGRSPGRCQCPGSTSRRASAHPPRRSWCTARGETARLRPLRRGGGSARGGVGLPSSRQGAESPWKQDTWTLGGSGW